MQFASPDLLLPCLSPECVATLTHTCGISSSDKFKLLMFCSAPSGGLCAMIAKCDSAALLLWNLSEVQLAKWGHLLGIDAIPILWQEAVVGVA